jgi:Putative Flp pilus-assembly TadE/G-like
MHDRGQAIPLVAVALVGLLGAASLAIDVGYWRYQQRLEQSAADSAAVAGAIELAYNGNYAAAARADATANGYTDNGADVVVQVNRGPSIGAYAGNTNAVEVIVQKKQPAFFAGILGKNYQWVSVRAVAVKNAAGRECIYALNGDIVMHGGGGGGISAPNCGLITNYNLTVTGQANVDATFVGYVGNGPGGGSYPQAQPQQAIAASDPCSTIPGCAYLAANPPPLQSCQQQSPAQSPLPPGEYCQPLDLSGGAVLAGGTYVLDQGMSAHGNGTISSCSGVTIYNKGGVTFSGNISVDLSAPTTGNYAGMVYYQPPSDTSGFTVNGKAGNENFSGGMYMPTAAATINGNVPSVTLLVVGSLTMNGGGIGANANGLPGVGHVVLAE